MATTVNRLPESVLAQVEQIFREVFADSALRLSPDMVTGDLPGWDSFRNVEILLACEAAWGIQFSSAQIDRIRSVADLVRTISAITP
jgi:acyl carrier protein